MGDAWAIATARDRCRVGGGRSWWAHRECTRISIELTIVPEKAEDNQEVDVSVMTDEVGQAGYPTGSNRANGRLVLPERCGVTRDLTRCSAAAP